MMKILADIMAKTADYGLVPFDSFFGELVRSTIDPKHRVSLQADALETIARRNKAYILSAESRDAHSPFAYRHPSVYFGQEVIATLESMEEGSQTNKRNLVQLVNGKAIDITAINSVLHARTAEIGGRRFLVAYPFFDWKLYLKRDTMHFTEEERLEWAVTNNYTQINIDKQGRMLFTKVMQPLGLSDALGYRGFGPTLIMGNPDYLVHPHIRRVKSFQAKNTRRASQKARQDELSDFGYEGFGSFLIDYPKELMQEEFSFELNPRVPRIHPRGSRTHPRAKVHGNNPQEQLDLRSPDF